MLPSTGNFPPLKRDYREKILFVNRFLKNKGIPADLRNKIHSFLEYNWESKKVIKIEEEEVMGLLNRDLRQQIKSHLTGRLLVSVDCFEKNFDIEFISMLSEVFIKRSYSYDDNIIYED